MRKRKEYLRNRLNAIVRGIGSVHKSAMEDRDFRKLWNEERLRRLMQEDRCKYCGGRFGRKRRAVLHHWKMPEKESELSGKKAELAIAVINGEIGADESTAIYLSMLRELMAYYKSMKDIDLICDSCHAGVHAFTRGNRGQMKLGI